MIINNKENNKDGQQHIPNEHSVRLFPCLGGVRELRWRF